MNHIEVIFEYTDAHMSINYDGAYLDRIINDAKKLCGVFDFQFRIRRKTIESYPNLVFDITIPQHPVFYNDYLNVLKAFSHLYGIPITNGDDA